MKINIFSKEIKGLNFNRRPIPVPYNYRIIYKIAQIILIIKLSSANSTCSLLKLHVISSALSMEEEKRKLVYFINNNLTGEYPFFRFDPSLNRAISFLLGEGIISQNKNSKFFLLEEGEKFFKELYEDREIMKLEKKFISEYGKKVSDRMLKVIKFEWGINCES